MLQMEKFPSMLPRSEERIETENFLHYCGRSNRLLSTLASPELICTGQSGIDLHWSVRDRLILASPEQTDIGQSGIDRHLPVQIRSALAIADKMLTLLHWTGQHLSGLANITKSPFTILANTVVLLEILNSNLVLGTEILKHIIYSSKQREFTLK